jgi:hypothetical protein
MKMICMGIRSVCEAAEPEGLLRVVGWAHIRREDDPVVFNEKGGPLETRNQMLCGDGLSAGPSLKGNFGQASRIPFAN